MVAESEEGKERERRGEKRGRGRGKGTYLATTHAQSCKRILERLFKAEEFEDREVDGGMEAETTFIRADRRVELSVKWKLECEVWRGEVRWHDGMLRERCVSGMRKIEWDRI